MYLHCMLFLLLFDKLDEKKLSLVEDTAVAAFASASVLDGFTTDANCKRDCLSIDLEDENDVSSVILANGLFFILSDSFSIGPSSSSA